MPFGLFRSFVFQIGSTLTTASNASVSFINLSLSDECGPDNGLFWQVGSSATIGTGSLFAGITQTIFDAGRRNAQVRSARAGADLAFASYRQTVLNGLEDVENAIQALEAAKARQAELASALDASNNAAIYARSQYRSGLIDFLTLLQSEQSLLSARDQLASARADQALALVRLYLALGGGWQPEATNPTGNAE